jgi:L-rhamnose mutarotase
MIRKAFVMSVFPERHKEYTERHNPIWPELESVLKAHGVHHYSIFLRPDTNHLFAYVEVESEERWEAIAQTDVCRRWWSFMQDVMPTNPNESPVSVPLTPVFYLEGMPHRER